MFEKVALKVLYKHINSWIPATCGTSYDLLGFGAGKMGKAYKIGKRKN